MISTQRKIAVTAKGFLIATLFSAVLFGMPAREFAQAAGDEKTAKLIEAARAEGKMTLYTVQVVNDSSRMIKRFEEKYPFLKVDLFRGDSVVLTNKILTEARARKYIPDVIEITGYKAAILKKEGMYTSYLSPESRTFPEGFKDPEGSWTSTYVRPYIMAYNTKLLSRKDMPASFEGFLQSRWKGKKIGFDPKEIEWFANMLKIMGEEKGMDFFRKFAAQDLNYRRDRTMIRDLIIAGEMPVGTGYAHLLEGVKKAGAKIDWVPVAPVIAPLTLIGLAAHASHSNAAKLYIDFCLSAEGQTMTGSFGGMPARPDVDSELSRAFKGVKLYPSDMSLADKFTAYSKQSFDVFGYK